MSAEPTQKAGNPTGTPGAGNGKSVNKAADSAYKAGSPTGTPGAGSNGKSANKAADSVYNDKAGQGGIAYKWLVVMVVVFGIFMSVLDATVVAVALPKLQAVFGATLNQVQWVVTGYLLAFAVIIPLVGYLADRFGIKRIYMTALVVFTGGSILCGLEHPEPHLLPYPARAGWWGTAPHRRELKRVPSPNWLLIITALLASPSLSLASQASGTLGCRDGASCDARCTETVASGANRRDSVPRYNCLEAAGRRDPH